MQGKRRNPQIIQGLGAQGQPCRNLRGFRAPWPRSAPVEHNAPGPTFPHVITGNFYSVHQGEGFPQDGETQIQIKFRGMLKTSPNTLGGKERKEVSHREKSFTRVPRKASPLPRCLLPR